MSLQFAILEKTEAEFIVNNKNCTLSVSLSAFALAGIPAISHNEEMPKVIRCKLTGTLGPPIKAHIIPKSFYQFSKSNPGPVYLFKIRKDSHTISRSPMGEYDSNLVTAEGERLFDELDGYAARFLIAKGKDAARQKEGADFLVANFDYPKLKLFFLSLLWRASVTSRPLFVGVKLDVEIEEALRLRILNRDPGGQRDFPVILGIHEDTRLKEGLPMVGPITSKWGGSTFVRFHLRYFVAYIGIEPKNQDWIFDFAIKEGGPLCVIVLSPLLKTPTGIAMIRALKDTVQNYRNDNRT